MSDGIKKGELRMLFTLLVFAVVVGLASGGITLLVGFSVGMNSAKGTVIEIDGLLLDREYVVVHTTKMQKGFVQIVVLANDDPQDVKAWRTVSRPYGELPKRFRVIYKHDEGRRVYQPITDQE